MGAMTFQNTSLTIAYSIIYSGADQRKHQSSASLVFVRGIQRWPVNSPHKGPVTRRMLLVDDVIMPFGVDTYHIIPFGKPWGVSSPTTTLLIFQRKLYHGIMWKNQPFTFTRFNIIAIYREWMSFSRNVKCSRWDALGRYRRYFSGKFCDGGYYNKSYCYMASCF